MIPVLLRLAWLLTLSLLIVPLYAFTMNQASIPSDLRAAWAAPQHLVIAKLDKVWSIDFSVEISPEHSNPILTNSFFPRYRLLEHERQLYFDFYVKCLSFPSNLYLINGDKLQAYHLTSRKKLLDISLPVLPNSQSKNRYLKSSLILSRGSFQEFLIGVVDASLFLFNPVHEKLKWIHDLGEGHYSEPIVIRLKEHAWLILVLKTNLHSRNTQLIGFDSASGSMLFNHTLEDLKSIDYKLLAVSLNSGYFADTLFISNPEGEIWYLPLKNIYTCPKVARLVTGSNYSQSSELKQILVARHKFCNHVLLEKTYDTDLNMSIIREWKSVQGGYTKGWEHRVQGRTTDMVVRQNLLLLGTMEVGAKLKMLNLLSGDLEQEQVVYQFHFDKQLRSESRNLLVIPSSQEKQFVLFENGYGITSVAVNIDAKTIGRKSWFKTRILKS